MRPKGIPTKRPAARPMRPETLAAASTHLPATIYQLAQRLGCSENWAAELMRGMVRAGHAKQWGQELRPLTGCMVNVYLPTRAKEPV